VFIVRPPSIGFPKIEAKWIGLGVSFENAIPALVRALALQEN